MPLASIAATAKREGRTLLSEVESKEVVKEAGINVTETLLARTREEAVATAQRLGFPVALKVVSPDIAHKSDVGGVKLGLADAQAAGRAYDDIMAAAKRAQPSAQITGVSVQKMARPGVEVIIGASKDAQFGPVLMFGLGGVMVEVLKDVSFRVIPLASRDAREMVREIKGYPVLQGVRGQKPVHVAGLEDALMKLSSYIQAHPQVKEVDLNPIFAYEDGLVAVDARVVLDNA